MENLPQTLTSFIITGLFIRFAIPLAAKYGLVDKPGGHKTHHDHIPVIGGIGIFLGLVSALSFFDLSLQQSGAILVAGLLLLLTGTIDDKYFLSAYIRFGAQIAAASILVVGDDTILKSLGLLLNNHESFLLGSWAIPLTIFATVGVINSVNMTDGLDGLAGGLSLVTLASVTVLFELSNISNAYFVVPLFTMAAILAFLMFNFRTPWLHKAKVFMGNGGSMLLGIIVAWLLIKFSQEKQGPFTPVIALWIFAVPLMDTVCIMTRRIMKGRSPFDADREHLHHLFLKLGFNVQHSVALVIAIASIFAVFGIAAHIYGVEQYYLFYLFLGLFALYFILIDGSWKKINAQENEIITGGTDNSLIHPIKRNKQL